MPMRPLQIYESCTEKCKYIYSIIKFSTATAAIVSDIVRCIFVAKFEDFSADGAGSEATAVRKSNKLTAVGPMRTRHVLRSIDGQIYVYNIDGTHTHTLTLYI